MVEIRILSDNEAEVRAWQERVIELISQHRGNEQMTYSGIGQGRKGDYLAYVSLGRDQRSRRRRRASG